MPAMCARRLAVTDAGHSLRSAIVGGVAALLACSLFGCSYWGSPEAVCLSTLDAQVADFTAARIVETTETPDGLTLRGTYDGGAFECRFTGDPPTLAEASAEVPGGGRIEVSG
jgi:hypothetical protein